MFKLTKDSVDIGIVVQDLERAARFYGETLGLPEVRTLEVTKEKAQKSGCARERFFFRAYRAGSVQLKVCQADAGPPPGGGLIDERTGFRYITFSVESVQETCRELRERGVSLRGEPLEMVPGRWILFFTDPDGNLLELVGPR